MRIIFTGLLLSLALGSQSSLAQPHPADDSVKTLKDKGVIQGYPDGEARNDRSVTRDELAQQLERLETLLSREHDNYASKASLKLVDDLVQSIYREFDAADERVNQLEDQQNRLNQRTNKVR